MIPNRDYHECVKGLANAVWSLNNNFFPSIRDPKGSLRVVLLLRPDIFDSIGFQNQTNKVPAIIRHVWAGHPHVSTNSVDVYVRYLRKKLRQGSDSELIASVRGRGYMFAAP